MCECSIPQNYAIYGGGSQPSGDSSTSYGQFKTGFDAVDSSGTLSVVLMAY
jgi:hypothetical protein